MPPPDPAAEAPAVIVERGVRARMRDGVHLVADIHRPSSDRPLPVLLMRQPYGRDIASTVVYARPGWFARHGYLVVIQDVRGRGDSEGDFEAFHHEAEDGHDTVLWAATLPGSNGRVGMYGFSYQGSTQYLAAATRPAPLRAIAPHMTALDLHSGWFHRGGLLQLQTTLAWGNQMLREDAARRGAWDAYDALEQSHLAGGLAARLPVAEVDPLVRPGLPRYVAEWLAHPEKDDHWAALDPTAALRAADLPVFHLSGWYDFYLRGSIDGYRTLSAGRGDRHFLVAGPWIHIPWGTRAHAGPLGRNARLDTDRLLVRWFDRWLKDDPDAVAETSGVVYFVLGEDAWRKAPHWPPPESREVARFLVSGGGANSRFGDGRLAGDRADGPSDVFNYDPEVPVLAPGGTMTGGLAWGPTDLAPQQEGNNLLVYDDAPAERPFLLAGPPRLELFVHSTAPDTAFVARLSRVTPDGEARFLTLGAARLREGRATADGAVRLIVPLDDIACRFEPGDVLRLDLASSAHPLLIRHPNTLEDPARVRRACDFRRATQTVFHDERRPSRLLLPVLDA